MANRTVQYMIDNRFIDPSVQKAFIQHINGTIEHNILLQEIINHARSNKHHWGMTDRVNYPKWPKEHKVGFATEPFWLFSTFIIVFRV